MRYSTSFETPLGRMIAVADETLLYSLKFMERGDEINEGIQSSPLLSIEKELKEYFQGILQEFKTPIALTGTPFQKEVWQELQKIPYGETRSYLEVSEAIGRDRAFRAVGSANGSNQHIIIVPCHRVINANGQLGGYGCGITKKQWLLKHEQMFRNR